MPNFPVKFLGSKGLNLDMNPTELDMMSWSDGANVRFESGKVRRAPVFRDITSNHVASNSILQDVYNVAAFHGSDGVDQVLAIDSSGNIALADPSAPLVKINPTGFVPDPANTQHTTTVLADILYINRETDVPKYFSAANSTMQYLPTANTAAGNWDPTWRCEILRAYKDFLCAFNVIKGAYTYDTMVKCSDATQVGQVPPSWNQNDPTTLAYENIIADMQSPIIDACVLGNDMIIYGTRQVFAMTFTGSTQFLYNFEQIFSDGGAINRNCAVEVNGLHWVFGYNDIYQHNGSTKNSISEGRVREYVYSTINLNKKETCFVQHNPQLREIVFAYTSLDADTAFYSPKWANKAMIYNYAADTWGTMDLPNVGGMCEASIIVNGTWNTYPNTITWLTVGGTWGDLLDTAKQTIIVASTKLTANSIGTPVVLLSDDRVYALDPFDEGSRISLGADAEANLPLFSIERQGITLSEANAPLNSYKRIRRIMPKARIFRGTPLTVDFGSSMDSAGTAVYQASTVFDPTQQYKVDTTISGRYLSLKFGLTALGDLEIVGVDIDVVSGGTR